MPRTSNSALVVYRKAPRKRRQKKALTKRERTQVKTIAKSLISQNVETKYLNQTVWTTLLIGDAENNAANYFYLHDLNPLIPAGDGVDMRTGDTVHMQRLFMRFGVRPQIENFDVAFAAPGVIPAVGTNPNKNARSCWYRLSILQVDRGSAATPTQIHELVSVPGRNRQDVLQLASQAFKKDIKVLHQRTVPIRWTYNVENDSATQHIRYLNQPKTSIGSLSMSFKNKKMLFNVGNQPSLYKYLLLIQYMRADNDTTYNDIGFSDCYLRSLWTFKDA